MYKPATKPNHQLLQYLGSLRYNPNTKSIPNPHKLTFRHAKGMHNGLIFEKVNPLPNLHLFGHAKGMHNG